MRSRMTALTIVAVWFTFGPGVSGTAGQCTDNEDCGAEQYCETSAGDCDGEGTCTDRPLMCPDVWDPVCGCDAATYANACSAAFAGVNISYEGQCLPPSCQSNDDCDTGDYSKLATGECAGGGTCSPQPTICPLLWDPVCGCDGITYGNDCLAAQAGINVASEGECPCRENSDCAQGEMCLNTVGDCLGEGLCTEQPLVCPMVWDPVCGCDESTYPNECSALLAGVNVAYEGECLTTCSANGDCLHDEYCDTAHNGCWATGACRLRPAMCIEIYDPVCGCNELTYNNACIAALDGITVTKTGTCGACPFDASSDCIFTDSLESGGTSRWSQVVN